MAPLRFGMFTTFYPPSNFGGDGIDVKRTARALVRRGHEVTVVHDVDAFQWLASTRVPPQPVRQDGVEVVELRSRLGIGAPLLVHQTGAPAVHRNQIDAIVRARQFDVVVFHNISLVGGPGLLDCGDDALKVYVAHEHWLVCPTHVLWRFNREPCTRQTCTACVLSHRRPPQIWRYTGGLERRLGAIDLFIARSEFSRQTHADFGFAHPMEVLPYFVPDDASGPHNVVETNREGRPRVRPYFLFVGRLARMKGLHTLIPIMASRPEADLLIVGDGEDEQMLRDLASSAPNVRFIGRVANEDLRRYYEQALAVICPSVGYETFGIVLIEALQRATPVIARRIGPFPEIVEQSGGGLLFSTDDELRAAMDRIQYDPTLRVQLAERGRLTVTERWSEGVVVDRFLQLVRDRLASR